MPRKTKPPQRLQHLPEVVLDFLRRQLDDGDWRRVVIEGGQPVVKNLPAVKDDGRPLPQPEPPPVPPTESAPPKPMVRIELPPDRRTARKLIEHGVMPGPGRLRPSRPAPPLGRIVRAADLAEGDDPPPPPQPEPERKAPRVRTEPAPDLFSLVSDPTSLDQARAALADLDRRLGRRTAEEMAEPDASVLAKPSPNGHTPPTTAPLPAPPVFRPPPTRPTPPPPAEPLPAPVREAVTQAREHTSIVVPKHPRYMKKTLQLLGGEVGEEGDDGRVSVLHRGELLGKIEWRNYRSRAARAEWERVLTQIAERQ